MRESYSIFSCVDTISGNEQEYLDRILGVYLPEQGNGLSLINTVWQKHQNE
jgi:hypothetical protein